MANEIPAAPAAPATPAAAAAPEGGAAPVAGSNNGAPVTPDPGTAPDANAQSPIDGTANADGGSTGDGGSNAGAAPTQTKADFAFLKLRKEKAAEATKATDLETQNQELKNQLADAEARANSKTDGSDSLLDDPKQWAENTKKEIAEGVRSEIAQEQRDNRIAKSSKSAESWLLNRSHMQDPNFARDLNELVKNDPELWETAGTAPETAAKAAYFELCSRRGIAPDTDGVKTKAEINHAAGQANGVTPTHGGDPGGGAKKWGPGEGKAYLAAVPMGSADFNARVAELKKARSEGRNPH